MNYYRYQRIGEFPRCKYCNGLMDYWDLREDESTYSHDECDAKAFGEHVRKIIENIFNRPLKDNNKAKGCVEGNKEKKIEVILCPCCGGTKIEEGGIWSSNGVMGPGYNSSNDFPHLFCLECGVIFKNLKEKE